MLHTSNFPFPTFASRIRPSLWLVTQSSMTCTIGCRSFGRSSRIMAPARLTKYHHCQLLWYSVGKSARAGFFGSHRMPSVVGGWRPVHAVFQKMLEKPSTTGLVGVLRTRL